MTIKELITTLEKLPENSTVFFGNWDTDFDGKGPFKCIAIESVHLWKSHETATDIKFNDCVLYDCAFSGHQDFEQYYPEKI